MLAKFATSCAIALGFAVVLQVGHAAPAWAVEPVIRTVASDPVTANFALIIVNEYRAENGLGPLTVDERLIDVASDRAAACASTGACTHGMVRPLTERMSMAGYPPSYGGETVADHSESITDALNTWRDNPVSANILLGPHATHLGFAEFTDGNRSFFVLDIAGDTASGWEWKSSGRPSS